MNVVIKRVYCVPASASQDLMIAFTGIIPIISELMQR